MTIAARRSSGSVGMLGVLTISVACAVLTACQLPGGPNGVASRPTAGTSVQSIDSVGAVAERVSAGVGQVVQRGEGDTSRAVFVFEETHVSPVGQIEIDVMLNRLIEGYGLRQIGLEGAFKKDGNINTQEYDPAPLQVSQPIRHREERLVALLERGQISNVEALALIYGRQLQVWGVENPNDYFYNVPKDADSAPVIYLVQIASQGMTRADINKCNALLDADKTDQGIQCFVQTNSFTRSTYDRLYRQPQTVPVEEMVRILDEIKATADKVSADVSTDDAANLAAFRKFYELRSNATKTMVASTLAIKHSLGRPLALVIGAAHGPGATELLKKTGASFALIEPKSLTDGSTSGDLSDDLFARKDAQQSVDPLGALVGGRKPQTVLNLQWFRRELDALLMIDELTEAAARGERPPSPQTLAAVTQRVRGVTVASGSLQMDGEDVEFKVSTTSGAAWFGRAREMAPGAGQPTEVRLEKRLLDGRATVQRQAAGRPDWTKGALVEIKINDTTVAKVSTDGTAIRNTTLQG